MTEQELLTAEEAQARVGVKRATFWALIKRHGIPRYTIPSRGRRVFFKPIDLDKLGQPARKAG